MLACLPQIELGYMATRVRSYSKVNLGLAIGPLRPDGFHRWLRYTRRLGCMIL